MAGLFPFSFSHCRCEVVLGEFLKETKKNPSSVKFAEMANILVIHCQTTGKHVAAPWTPSSLEARLPVLDRVLAAVRGPRGPPPPQKPPPPVLDSAGRSERQCDGGPGAVGPCGPPPPRSPLPILDRVLAGVRGSVMWVLEPWGLVGEILVLSAWRPFHLVWP